MKKLFIFLAFIALYSNTLVANNDFDTLQYISNVTQIIDNAVVTETSPSSWAGEWTLNEVQRTQYMPGENAFQYFHIPEREVEIEIVDNQGVLKFMDYLIVIDDLSKTIINIPPQLVDNMYDSQDYIFGKLVLIEKELYMHLRIVGTQDFAVDIFDIGKKKGDEANALLLPIENSSAFKILCGGQLLIERDGKTYTVTGTLVR